MLNLTQNVTKAKMIFFDQCAENCRAECITYVRHNALNSYLWILFTALTILILYLLINRNEDAIKKVSIMTGQPDTEHIQKTINMLLLFGIILIIAYIIVFLVSSANIIPLK